MFIYFGVVKQHSVRTGELLGRSCCVVRANNEDEARKKIWAKCGHDNAAIDFVEEIGTVDLDNVYNYTVYL